MIPLLVGVLALLMDPETEEALKTFAREYGSAAVSNRAAAVTVLGRLQNPLIRSTLGTLLVSDLEEVRMAAAHALGGFSSEKDKVSALLLSALPSNAKLFGAEAAILGALGRLGEESALPTIHQYFESREAKDVDFTVAKAAIQASGAIKSGESIGSRIEFAKRLERGLRNGTGKNPDKGGSLGLAGGAANDPQSVRAKTLFPVVLKALQSITGEKWGTLLEWTLWWERHQASGKTEK